MTSSKLQNNKLALLSLLLAITGTTATPYARIPKNQFNVFTFERDLWHPRFSKKYIDSEQFVIVNHDKAGIDTYVELLQVSSKAKATTKAGATAAVAAPVTPAQDMSNQQDVKIDGMNCNCEFIKKETIELAPTDDVDELQEEIDENSELSALINANIHEEEYYPETLFSEIDFEYQAEAEAPQVPKQLVQTQNEPISNLNQQTNPSPYINYNVQTAASYPQQLVMNPYYYPVQNAQVQMPTQSPATKNLVYTNQLSQVQNQQQAPQYQQPLQLPQAQYGYAPQYVPQQQQQQFVQTQAPQTYNYYQQAPYENLAQTQIQGQVEYQQQGLPQAQAQVQSQVGTKSQTGSKVQTLLTNQAQAQAEVQLQAQANLNAQSQYVQQPGAYQQMPYEYMAQTQQGQPTMPQTLSQTQTKVKSQAKAKIASTQGMPATQRVQTETTAQMQQPIGQMQQQQYATGFLQISDPQQAVIPQQQMAQMTYPKQQQQQAQMNMPIQNNVQVEQPMYYGGNVQGMQGPYYYAQVGQVANQEA